MNDTQEIILRARLGALDQAVRMAAHVREKSKDAAAIVEDAQVFFAFLEKP